MNTNELKTQIRILTEKIFNASSHNIVVTKENTKKLNEMSQQCFLLQEQLQDAMDERQKLDEGCSDFRRMYPEL